MFEFHWGWDFAFKFLSIAIIDLALSGDNALVIGMAAASLEKRARMWAIVAGGGLAILLRILLTTIATELLMQIPLLSAVGGLILFWVAWKLLRLNASKGEAESKEKRADTFRQAIILIVTADFMMSLDNVIAVAGTAHGDIILLVLGLLISMPLLMTTGGVVSVLIDRLKWLVYLGAAVIMFAGARMVFEDRFIESRLAVPGYIYLPISALIAIAGVAFLFWNNGRQARRLPVTEKKSG